MLVATTLQVPHNNEVDRLVARHQYDRWTVASCIMQPLPRSLHAGSEVAIHDGRRRDECHRPAGTRKQVVARYVLRNQHMDDAQMLHSDLASYPPIGVHGAQVFVS